MVDPKDGLFGNSLDDNLVIDQIDEPEYDSVPMPIPAHSYPAIIHIFLRFTVGVFVVNFFTSSIWHVPTHLKALNTINKINSFVQNEKYGEALQLHEELCRAYPQTYVKSYGIEIAETCFEYCQYNKSYFKKGIAYLQSHLRFDGLNQVKFSKLYQRVPEELKETYESLFDVWCREKNNKKEYTFKLNPEKVRSL